MFGNYYNLKTNRKFVCSTICILHFLFRQKHSGFLYWEIIKGENKMSTIFDDFDLLRLKLNCFHK